MKTMRTVAIYIGSLHKLDAVFERLHNEKRFSFSEKSYGPVHDKFSQGADVLLTSAASPGTGELYVFVGVARNACLSEDRTHVTFSECVRFHLPVVAAFVHRGFIRTHVMGGVREWCGEFNYLAPGAAARVEALADESLSALLPSETAP